MDTKQMNEQQLNNFELHKSDRNITTANVH